MLSFGVILLLPTILAQKTTTTRVANAPFENVPASTQVYVYTLKGNPSYVVTVQNVISIKATLLPANFTNASSSSSLKPSPTSWPFPLPSPSPAPTPGHPIACWTGSDLRKSNPDPSLNTCYIVDMSDGSRQYGAISAQQAAAYYQNDTTDSSYKILKLCFTDECNNPNGTIAPMPVSPDFTQAKKELVCYSGSPPYKSTPSASLGNDGCIIYTLNGTNVYSGFSSWSLDSFIKYPSPKLTAYYFCYTSYCNAPGTSLMPIGNGLSSTIYGPTKTTSLLGSFAAKTGTPLFGLSSSAFGLYGSAQTSTKASSTPSPSIACWTGSDLTKTTRNNSLNVCFTVQFNNSPPQYGSLDIYQAQYFYYNDVNDPSYKILNLCFTDECNDPKIPLDNVPSSFDFSKAKGGLVCYSGIAPYKMSSPSPGDTCIIYKYNGINYYTTMTGAYLSSMLTFPPQGFTAYYACDTSYCNAPGSPMSFV